MKNRASTSRKGRGFYTYEQVKDTTPFQYFAHIVIGTIVASLGGTVLYHELMMRAENVRKYGSGDTPVWGWITGLVGVVIGLFMAHNGLIFYAQRIVKGVLGATDKSPGRKRRGAR